jgi:hypothetical protein
MLKSTLGLRPGYNTRDDRISSHVLLYWLALLLVQIADIKTDMKWSTIRPEMDRLH